MVGANANGDEGIVDNATDEQFHDSIMYVEEHEAEDALQEEMKAPELEEKNITIDLQRANASM